jgi:hypothetical protein
MCSYVKMIYKLHSTLHINIVHYTNVMLNNFGNKYFLFGINEQQRNNKMSKHVILRFNSDNLLT